MVFASKKQRKGFFANLANIKKQHDQQVTQKLNKRVAEETKELSKLNKQLKTQALHERVRVAKLQAVQNQRKQLQDLKTAERDAKREIFNMTRTGRVVAALKQEAKQTGRSVSIIGGGLRRVATSDSTKKVIKGLSKQLLGTRKGKRGKKIQLI